jgi:hypothetical protein
VASFCEILTSKTKMESLVADSWFSEERIYQFFVFLMKCHHIWTQFLVLGQIFASFVQFGQFITKCFMNWC